MHAAVQGPYRVQYVATAGSTSRQEFLSREQHRLLLRYSELPLGLNMFFDPPLGTRQIHVLQPSEAAISVYLWLEASSDVRPGQCEVWANHDDGWAAIPFEVRHGALHLLEVSNCRPAGHTFEAKIPVQLDNPLEFTYRLRKPDGSTQWLGQPHNNIVLHIHRSTHSRPSSLSEIWTLPPPQSSRITLNQRHCVRATGGRICALSWTVPLACSSLSLGSPQGPVLRSLALQRSPERLWWLYPESQDGALSLKPGHQAQLVLFQPVEHPDLVVALLPLSITSTCVLQQSSAPDKGHFFASVESWCHQAPAHVLVGWAPSSQIYQLIEDLRWEGRKLSKSLASSSSCDCDPITIPTQLPIEPLRQENSPKRTLSWCTYETLSTSYTLRDVLNALSSLKRLPLAHAQSFDSVLLDDGWQDVTEDKRLRSFGCSSVWLDSFGPCVSLKEAVRQVKQSFPAIQRIGVWITINGCWNGLDFNSPSMKIYEPSEIRLDCPAPFVTQQWLPALQHIKAFWNDYATSLREAGIDFVKVDNQAMMDWITPNNEVALALKRHIFEAMQRATAKVFGSANVTHCVGSRHSASSSTSTEQLLIDGPLSERGCRTSRF